MADFTLATRDVGIYYIGICCGAGPYHVRDMAEVLGRKVPASRYSPDISLHPIFGEEKVQKKRYWECLLGPMPDSQEAE